MSRKEESLTLEEIRGVLLSSKHSGGKYLKLKEKFNNLSWPLFVHMKICNKAKESKMTAKMTYKIKPMVRKK